MHEQSITVEADGLHYNIPTVYKGKKLSKEEATQLFMQHKLGATSVHPTREEAEASAKARSDAYVSDEDFPDLRSFENAVYQFRINYQPRISAFNQGRWPTQEEQEARHEEIKKQLRIMKEKNPKLYERLPLLHDMLALSPEELDVIKSFEERKPY